MIKVKNLSKSFNKQLVLDNISIDINNGDFISIVGPSGAGKTTFLNILGTIDDYDKNPKTSILFNDTDLTKLNDDKLSSFRNKEIGFIFQFHQLLPELTAQENILLPSMIGENNEKESMNNLNKLSKILDIKSILEKKPEFISGGEKQRVSIARALINDPQIILADEPTGSLDIETAKNIFNILKKQINSNRLIIFATHNRFFANKSDCLLEIVNGNIKTING